MASKSSQPKWQSGAPKATKEPVESHWPFTAADLIGVWADSLGNKVSVESYDAYSAKLVATLSKPPRKDITLTVRPGPDGGWTCGNAKLDRVGNTLDEIAWPAADGRVSVWIRFTPDNDNESL